MNNKSIAQNSFYNIIYQGFTVFFPLISIAYFSRILLAEGVGKFAYAQTVVNYFITLAALGIPLYGVKLIAQYGIDINAKSRSFWEMFYLNALSTAVFSMAYYVFISCNGYFDGRRTIFYIMGSLLVFNIANIDWYYQGIEDYGYITKRSISFKIISFILMVIFVRNSDDYIIYAAIFCLGSVGGYIFNIIHLRGQIKFVGIQHCKISRHVVPVMILLCSSIATEIYTMLDSVLLEYFHGEVYVGYYSNCVKIVRMVYALSTAMVVTFYPRISLYLKEDRLDETNELISKGFKVLLIFSVPSAAGLFLTADSLIPVLLGSSFLPSVGCLRILSILVIVFSIAMILGHIILMASGNEKRILLASICGASVNFVLNMLLIPSYKHYGAAAASVLGELLVTAVLLNKSLKIVKISVEKSFLSSLLISMIIMTASIKVIDFWEISHLTRLISCIILGMTTYFGSLMFFRNTIILYLSSKLQKKIGSGMKNCYSRNIVL